MRSGHNARAERKLLWRSHREMPGCQSVAGSIQTDVAGQDTGEQPEQLRSEVTLDPPSCRM
jgi:hypothetical protein